MDALITEYRGATNTRGARILVRRNGKVVHREPYPYALSGEKVHRHAVQVYLEKIGWTGTFEGGDYGKGYAYVEHTGDLFAVQS